MIVGDYVVIKYQRRASFVKLGGVIANINKKVAIVTDGKDFEPYLLSELTTFKKHHNTLLGVQLLARKKK